MKPQYNKFNKVSNISNVYYLSVTYRALYWVYIKSIMLLMGGNTLDVTKQSIAFSKNKIKNIQYNF
jgi:hypothetical protein